MKAVWEAFTGDDSISPTTRQKPVSAVILTHHHADHCNGTSFFSDHKLFANDSGMMMNDANDVIWLSYFQKY
jgi:glyoxylase-like metal-dependent hydrolase (beta-lactamase superfamily II)